MRRPWSTRRRQSKRSRGWPAGVLVLLILSGAAVRFYGLSEKGLYGSDTVYYTNIAKQWSEGDFVYSIGDRRDSHRPVIFALFGAAIVVFGYHDDSIKLLNAGVDCLNILLLFVAAYLLCGRRGHALLAASAYAFLPFAIYLCRIEMTHTLSTFLVLSSLLLFILHSRARGSRTGDLWLASCGAVTGLAALAHEDLIFIAAGYGVFWLLALLRWCDESLGPREVVRRGVVFSVPLLAVALPMLIFNSGRARKLATAAAGGDVAGGDQARGGIVGFFGETLRLTWNAIAGSSSVVVAHLFFVLVAALAAIALWRLLRRRPPLGGEPLRHLPLIVLAVYMAIYSFFFEILFTRAFLPFVPLVFMTLIAGYPAVCDRFLRPVLSRSLVLAVAAVILIFDFEHFSERPNVMATGYSKQWAALSPPDFRWRQAVREFQQSNYRQSWARGVFEVMRDHVDADSRLLITSSLRYPHPGRRTLQVGYYLGDDAIYAIDHDEPLETLISQRNIRFVLFTPFRADFRVLDWPDYQRYLYQGRWGEREPLRLGALYGFAAGGYSLEAEYSFLTDFLAARGARVIHATGGFRGGSRPPRFSSLDESFVIYQLPAA